MSSRPIPSSLVGVTVGGVEDDPLFADALSDRAAALSRNPDGEVVLITAHGAGEDDRNEYWRGVLTRIASRMRENGGAGFRAIEVGTWREDWPDKRAPEVERMRGVVSSATTNGLRVIVIPARTTGRGPESEFLKGLDFKLGEGFAPHPNFLKWVEKKIAEGEAELRAERTGFAVPLTPPSTPAQEKAADRPSGLRRE